MGARGNSLIFRGKAGLHQIHFAASLRPRFRSMEYPLPPEHYADATAYYTMMDDEMGLEKDEVLPIIETFFKEQDSVWEQFRMVNGEDVSAATWEKFCRQMHSLKSSSMQLLFDMHVQFGDHEKASKLMLVDPSREKPPNFESTFKEAMEQIQKWQRLLEL